MKANYIGLMSGTSLDGIDASIITTDGRSQIQFIANHYYEYSQTLRSQIAELIHTASYNNFLAIERDYTTANVSAVEQLLQKANHQPADINAIGFHGQTIFHAPQDGITWQMGNGSILAAKLKINTICDFRRQDLALGGGGAPLVPIFHQAICPSAKLPAAIINIGGVSNISYITQTELRAWDIGPGCALINDACRQHFGQDYDDGGQIAASAQTYEELVDNILQDQYFRKSGPKCLDRNHFTSYLSKISPLKPADKIATLTLLTAKAIASDILKLKQIPQNIYLCGGGSHNSHLTKTIKELLPAAVSLRSISSLSPNLDPDYIESAAFAYLAARRVHNLPSTMPSTTGTKQAAICGAIISK